MADVVKIRSMAISSDASLPEAATPTAVAPLSPFARVRRLALLASERVRSPSPASVHAVNLATTYYCNSKCTMCSIWEIYKRDKTRAAAELSFGDIRQIFSSPHFAELRSVSLTGGEPFLRKDLVDIAGFFLTTFPSVALAIPTDSVSPKLTIAAVQRLVQRYQPGRGRLAISVSLDGLRDAHDRQRGVPCFDKAMEVLTALAPMDLSLNVSFTITAINSADLLATYEKVQEFGASFNCQFAQSSANYYGQNSTGLRALTQLELDHVRAQVTEIANRRWDSLPLKSRLTDTGDYFLRRMVDYQVAPRRIFSCYSGTHSCFIDPYGDVYPCIMLDESLGNAKASGFDQVWQGPAAEAARRRIAAHACHCWTPCEAAPSLGRSLDSVPSLTHLIES